MGLFGGGNSKRVTNNTSRNYNSSFGIGGDNNGIGISGDNNTVTMTDYEAIRESMDVVRYSIDSNQSNFETMSLTLGDITSDAFLSVSQANDGANQLSEIALNTSNEALAINQGISEFAMMQVSESQQTIADLAAQNGDNVTYLADSSIAGNQTLAADFGDNVTYLADSSIAGNQALTETTMNNNALLVSQFGSDMLAMSDKNAVIAQSSIDSNAILTSQFGSDLNQAYSNFGADLATVSDNALESNKALASEVTSLAADISLQSNQTLLQMANLQEQGLDSALQVASNVSMNDNSEASISMVQSIMWGLGAIGVAVVFKR